MKSGDLLNLNFFLEDLNGNDFDIIVNFGDAQHFSSYISNENNGVGSLYI